MVHKFFYKVLYLFCIYQVLILGINVDRKLIPIVLFPLNIPSEPDCRLHCSTILSPRSTGELTSPTSSFEAHTNHDIPQEDWHFSGPPTELSSTVNNCIRNYNFKSITTWMSRAVTVTHIFLGLLSLLGYFLVVFFDCRQLTKMSNTTVIKTGSLKIFYDKIYLLNSLFLDLQHNIRGITLFYKIELVPS